MATDHCSYLRSRVTEKLSKLGLREERCDQFGDDVPGHGAMYAGSVVYFRGHGRLVAIIYSDGNGPSCFIGSDKANVDGASCLISDNALLSDHEDWSSLWDLVGMTNDFDGDNMDSIGAYLDQFPARRDAMLDLIAEKVGQLLSP